MSSVNLNDGIYHDAIEKVNDYIQAFNHLYQLETFIDSEIEEIFQEIQTIIIEKYKLDPSKVLKSISTACKYHHKYLKSYWALFKKVYDKYSPKIDVNELFIPFKALVFKEYGIKTFSETSSDAKIITQLLNRDIFEIHSPGTILHAIMNDDLQSFIPFTEQPKFHKNKLIHHYLQLEIYSIIDWCCYYGSVNCFKYMRSKFNAPLGKTSLSLSFLSQKSDIVKECLQNVKPDNYSMNFAVASHNIEFVTYLLNNYTFDVDLRICYNYNNLQSFLLFIDTFKLCSSGLLYISEFMGNNILAKYFIEKGCDVDIKEKLSFKTPLHFAIENNNFELVKLLIEHGYKANQQITILGHSELSFACQNGNYEITEYLIQNGAQVNFQDITGNTPLHYAANFNFVKICELLVKNGAVVDSKNRGGETPLLFAAKNNSLEAAKFLVEKGVDVNVADMFHRNCFYSVIIGNHVEFFDFLVSLKASVKMDFHGENLIHTAVYHNRKAFIKKLIELGLDPNKASDSGETPLFIAAAQGYWNIVQLLLQYDVDVNLQSDSYGDAPLHHAVDNYKVCKLLIDKGADVNIENYNGETSLIKAVLADNVKSAEVLLQNGADIEKADYSGHTPIMFAKRYKKHKMLKFLTDKGADTSELDNIAEIDDEYNESYEEDFEN
ncbi:hypothetical protein TVAG_051040 [Trichomonas vaginalis G3]|uniref:DUF3447 domain-containing protein n=1 Tax=Trichomonas vaginalis (strain ATCC PRA-98 / G3) TaxID=412133 RepID=A2EER3_TRIV3|nr:spectrin binding [Trichomonas vaginalis G3]EAY08869.1 hypothetical protein TVAG_051040 [Trichomonas vaginalis G3]KAI5489364.1 spectrin binding [Trichomonas vaginalis G3]|eukprot:XP_001321092.1 hypothetical protein [Trichomonas vaginalis G3]